MDEERTEDIDDLEDDYTVVELEDETGKKVPFEFLDLIEFEGSEYVVLMSLEEDEEAEEDQNVIILRLEEVAEDEEAYISVDDDRILEEVFNIFKERNKDNFNFVD